jgi:hypothetical protein
MQPASGPIAPLRGAVQPPPIYRPQQQHQPAPPVYQSGSPKPIQNPTVLTGLSHKGIQPVLTNRIKQNPPIFSAPGEKNGAFVQAKSAAACPHQANPFDRRKTNIATVSAPLIAGHSNMAGNGLQSGWRSTVAQPIQPKPGTASAYGNGLSRTIQRMDSGKQTPEKQFEEYTFYLDKSGKPPIVILRLNMAQAAIATAKRKIPHAGNILQHVFKTEGQSYGLTKLAREEADQESWWSKIYGEDRMVRSAITARRVGGGNCGEHANVVYFELLKMNLGDRISRCHMTDEIDHAFVLIGDPKDEKTLVVADAWADVPQAIRYKDWTFYPATYGIDRQEVSQGQNPLKPVRQKTKDRKQKIAKKLERLKRKVGLKEFGLNEEQMLRQNSGFYEAPTTVRREIQEVVEWELHATPEQRETSERFRLIFEGRIAPPPRQSSFLDVSGLDLPEISPGPFQMIPPPPPPLHRSSQPLPPLPPRINVPTPPRQSSFLDVSGLDLPEISPRPFQMIPPPPPPLHQSSQPLPPLPPRINVPTPPRQSSFLDVSGLDLPEISPRPFQMIPPPPPPFVSPPRLPDHDWDSDSD